MAREEFSLPQQRSLQRRRRARRRPGSRKKATVSFPQRPAEITWETGWGASWRATCGSEDLRRSRLFWKQLNHRVMERLQKDHSQPPPTLYVCRGPLQPLWTQQNLKGGVTDCRLQFTWFVENNSRWDWISCHFLLWQYFITVHVVLLGQRQHLGGVMFKLKCDLRKTF